ncbi:hypothetical protein UREG_07888 [Uncinocarpus reesii 1704]|uniref:chitinase n=1 Tax=Uncinocarpus reesii (strain UAMH 1704) TaxID=336963 RepID=C4JXV0_UNCRE|nr:uncharacterized protein UREG_07888 [Uncinocarpus reesii 1704]EEP83023.1 hypothetical protein UREG_07888 [Uncinocarpus reesii 1704]
MSFIWSVLLSLIALFSAADASLNTTSSNNLALYWGQNSYGEGSGDLAQKPLGYYCERDNCTTFPGTDLLNCPNIGADISKCQRKGKTVLLSIGGATYSEGGFRSEEAAIAGADMIWETFGPKKNGSTRPRPFGDAAIDGFDFDFEATVLNMAPFANRLRSLMAADRSKKYYLTATPQCPYPDWYNKEILEGNIFDAVFIQFYNNFCGLNAFQPGEEQQQSFNLNTWDNWARTVSKNKGVKVFVGAPANRSAAGSGYVDTARLAEIIEYSRSFSSFGGVMLWDASQAYANDKFISDVKAALNAAP